MTPTILRVGFTCGEQGFGSLNRLLRVSSGGQVDFESAFPTGPPSLAHCDSLKITGPVRFEAGVACRGRVSLTNPSTEPRVVSAGTYENVEKVLA